MSGRSLRQRFWARLPDPAQTHVGSGRVWTQGRRWRFSLQVLAAPVGTNARVGVDGSRAALGLGGAAHSASGLAGLLSGWFSGMFPLLSASDPAADGIVSEPDLHRVENETLEERTVTSDSQTTLRSGEAPNPDGAVAPCPGEGACQITYDGTTYESGPRPKCRLRPVVASR